MRRPAWAAGNAGGGHNAVSGMTGGLIALVVTLAVATAAGLVLRRYSGRFRPVRGVQPAGPAAASTPLPDLAQSDLAQPDLAQAELAQSDLAPAPAAAGRAAVADVLTEADLGTALGERATLVQFSTVFCAPCRPTRQILGSVAAMLDGVRHVDVDATTRMDLVRRLRILSTPTVLVLGPDGAISKRATGLPRKVDVIAALGQVIGPELSTSPTELIDNIGNAANGISVDSGSDSRSEAE